MALADYRLLVNSLVRDQAGTLTPDDVDRAIDMARLRYSGDCERTVVEDVTWVAPGYFGPMPLGWTAGAYIIEGEWPMGQHPKATLELRFYVSPTEQRLAAAQTLAAGQVVRVSFAAFHVLGAVEDTVPSLHREALASYAASLLCRQLAAHYSAERETSLNADGSNTDSRARNYALRAKDYRTAYFAGIGKADPQGGGGAGSASSGTEPAASVSAWAGRSRNVIRTNDVMGPW